MDNKIIFTNISVYSITHAVVDAAGAALLFAIFFLNLVELQTFIYLVILYNVLAFTLQSPFGLLIDKVRMPVYAAMTGALLIAVSLFFIKLPLIAVSIAGIGNALFHVGGGIISLNLIPKKATMPGIYVATGALGLMIGILIGKGGDFIAWPFLVILVVLSVLMWKIKKPNINYKTKLEGNFKWFELILLLLLLSIAVRGLIGMVLIMPWKSNLYLLIILTIAIVLGKVAGGILGDKYGWMKISLTGLTVSGILLSFFTNNPYLAIIGVFFFNLTMPITLTAISNMLPGRAGFAFGLTTLALIIGALPTFTGLKTIMNNQLFVLSIIIISATALYLGLKLYFDQFYNKKQKYLKNKI